VQQVAIPLDEVRRLLLTPTQVQIDSPQRIADALLQPFQEGRLSVLLLPREQGLLAATLHAVYETSLIATVTRAARLLRHQGKVVRVVFPASPQQHYVMQTVVEDVSLDQVTLRYQHGRVEERQPVRLAAPPRLHLVPPALVRALEDQQVRVVRALTWPAAQQQARGQPAASVLVDYFQPRPFSVDSAPLPLPEAAPLLGCDLNDLSCGGAGLTLAGAPPPAVGLQALILLHLSLPLGPADLGTGQPSPHLLSPLGIIRAVRVAPSRSTLHVHFLQRLPQEYGSLFTHLARGQWQGASAGL
jgi:hypothetical protein